MDKPEAPAVMNYPDKDATFLILNILAHDVIHDYGANSTEKRWSDVQKYAKQFSTDYSTFSMPTVGGAVSSTMRQKQAILPGSAVTNETDILAHIPAKTMIKSLQPKAHKTKTVLPYQFAVFQPDALTKNEEVIVITPEDILLQHYQILETEFKSYKQKIATGILFCYFLYVISFLRRQKQSKVELNFMDCNLYMVPIDSDTQPLTDLYEDIILSFRSYCILQKKSEKMDVKEYFQTLSDFLSDQYVDILLQEEVGYNTSSDIPSPSKANAKTRKRKRSPSLTRRSLSRSRSPNNAMNISKSKSPSYRRKTYRATKRRRLEGGAKKKVLTYEDSNQIKTKIDALMEDETTQNELTEMDTIYKEYRNNNGVIADAQKKKYDTNKKTIVKRFQALFREYGQTKIAGGLDGDDIFPLIKIRFTRTMIEIPEHFKQYIQKCMLPFEAVIREYNEQQERLLRQQERDKLAEESGKLTSEDKKVREQFCEYIAKSGLYITECCDKDGMVLNKRNTLGGEDMLRTEIDILLYQADWHKKSAKDGWGRIGSADLDTHLITHVYGKYTPVNVNSCVKKGSYIINNAAPIPSALKNVSYCPITSILDGMSQCSWKSSKGRIESGNIDFTIQNKDEPDLYYRGKLTPTYTNKDKYPSEVRLELDIKTPKTTFQNTKMVAMGDNSLEAHVVLKNTLLSVIEYITQKASDTTRDQLFTGGNIFGKLYEISAETPSLFGIVFNEILYKGVGDLFQEINAVSKHGGYSDSYRSDDTILSFNNTSGDQLRYFVANDRPSGTRFIYMLSHGNPEEINTKSIGGYYSDNKQFIVKHPSNNDICKTA
jgi:hypothetical protein